MSHTGTAEPSDENLVRKAREGDARAFEKLLARHESRVMRVLRLMGVDHQDREDVAQEVFVRIFRHLGGFRKGRPFHSWVYKIAVNASHDYRSRNRRKVAAASWEAIPESLRQTENGHRGGTEEQVALRQRLERALGGLSKRERAVFVLCEMEGLENREVASSLGISTITVRRHLGRARKRLSSLLLQSG